MSYFSNRHTKFYLSVNLPKVFDNITVFFLNNLQIMKIEWIKAFRRNENMIYKSSVIKIKCVILSEKQHNIGPCKQYDCASVPNCKGKNGRDGELLSLAFHSS